MGMLSFREFQATRVARSLTADEMDRKGLKPTHSEVFEYGDRCFIFCREDGLYELLVGRSWRSMDLEFLERKLFAEWYYEG